MVEQRLGRKVHVFFVAKNGSLTMCHSVSIRNFIRDEIARKQKDEVRKVLNFNVSTKLDFRPKTEAQVPESSNRQVSLEQLSLIEENQIGVGVNFTQIFTTDVVAHNFWNGEQHIDKECVKSVPFRIKANERHLSIKVVSLLNGTILHGRGCKSHGLQIQLRLKDVTSEMLGIFTLTTHITVFQSGPIVFDGAKAKRKKVQISEWEIRKDEEWKDFVYTPPDESRERVPLPWDVETIATIVAVCVVNVIVVVVVAVFIFKRVKRISEKKKDGVEEDGEDNEVKVKDSLPLSSIPPLPLPSAPHASSSPTPEVPSKSSRLREKILAQRRHGPKVVDDASDDAGSSTSRRRAKQRCRRKRGDDDDGDESWYSLCKRICESPPFVLLWCGVITGNLFGLLWALVTR